MNRQTLKVGVIGCGAISKAYFLGCRSFPGIEIVHCADLDISRAETEAGNFGIARHGSVAGLLADPEIAIVVNLTIPRAHTEINLAALSAGKHVYCEKPFCVDRKEGAEVLAEARKRGLLVASAPDTFLGPAHQSCRQLIDEGAIGEPVAAALFMGCPGHESWHPNPTFYYDIGGGPMFDMGPYYLTAAVNMLGPIASVSGSTRITFPERRIGSGPLQGSKIPVKTPTHIAGTMEFQNGAIASVITSFDMAAHHLPAIEIYGTEGALLVPDPNGTDGKILLRRSEEREWRDMPHTHNSIPARGAGVADLAQAIVKSQPPRASGDLALHIVDAMQAFEESSTKRKHVQLSTSATRPRPLQASCDGCELNES